MEGDSIRRTLLGGRRGLGLLSMEHYAAQAGLDLSI